MGRVESMEQALRAQVRGSGLPGGFGASPEAAADLGVHFLARESVLTSSNFRGGLVQTLTVLQS